MTKSNSYIILISKKGGMQFDGEYSANEEENIEEMLEDLAVADDGLKDDIAKKDSTIFAIDCSQQMTDIIEGESLSEFDKIMESYSNFMMSKIIANTNDRVGLILFNINAKNNSLNFDNICTVHQLGVPSAKSIKSTSTICEDYVKKYGLVKNTPLHQVLWLYGQEIRQLAPSKYHLRLFLFTTEDCPHEEGDQRREQAINHARQLAAKNVHLELFPIRKAKRSIFDIRKFYQQILTLDPEEINQTVIDSSNKILDLQSRLRQKQFKKRTLNRLLMKVGEQTNVGIKIFSLYQKAKKPLGKKVEAVTNKNLKRVTKRLNTQGDVLFDEQIGSCFPLGGQRIKISKAQMNKIKSIEQPGITIIGFKPKNLIKPYHNIRTSYFLYPDEDHVSGSSQFFDALIDQLIDTNQVAIIKLMPRNNQQIRFAALFPQKEEYDPEDHTQTPPGFNMIILPYADDIVNYAGNKTVVKPHPISSELVQVTKLLINNLTVNNFDFRDFENPSLQKFYGHLQAHALNEPRVEEREDLLLPDQEGFHKFKDIIELVREAAMQELGNVKQQIDREGNCVDNDSDCMIEKKKGGRKAKGQKKEVKQEIKTEEIEKKSKVKSTKVKEVKEQTKGTSKSIEEVETIITNGEINSLKVAQMRQYLINKGLSQKGKKQELIDRIMVYLTYQNQI